MSDRTLQEMAVASLCGILSGSYQESAKVELLGYNSLRVEFNDVVWKLTVDAEEKKVREIHASGLTAGIELAGKNLRMLTKHSVLLMTLQMMITSI